MACRNCNRTLRAAILGIADNLIGCNHHFNVLGHHWGRRQGPTRYPHPRGQPLLPHRLPDGRRPPGLSPSRHPGPPLHPRQTDRLPSRARHPVAEVLRDLQAAVGQLPPRSTRPRPSRCTRSWKRSKTAAAAGRNCSGTSCRSCWHAWGSAWYNRQSQGSRPPLRTGFASRERLSSPRGEP